VGFRHFEIGRNICSTKNIINSADKKEGNPVQLTGSSVPKGGSKTPCVAYVLVFFGRSLFADFQTNQVPIPLKLRFILFYLVKSFLLGPPLL